ncbi:replication initiation protein [Persephonella sp.]|nr:replication initiation protein [Aquificota bacterium]
MTKEEKQKVDEIVMKTFTLAYELGTTLDELHRMVRELRFSTNDKDLQSALINLEHAFFMTAQSINILKEQTRNALIPMRKAQTCEE